MTTISGRAARRYDGLIRHSQECAALYRMQTDSVPRLRPLIENERSDLEINLEGTENARRHWLSQARSEPWQASAHRRRAAHYAKSAAALRVAIAALDAVLAPREQAEVSRA